MSSHRFLFYNSDLAAASATVTLSGDEHHHLAHALRVSSGDILHVTNGRGLIVECCVEAVGRATTVAEITSVVADEPPEPELVLALGTIRKDKFERAFEQCVELGITRCLPFVSENAQGKAYASKFLSRLHKIAVASIKQSYRSYLPHVGEPMPLERLVSVARRMTRVVVGHRPAPPVRSRRADGEDTLIVVGPEAGLAQGEIEALVDAGGELAQVSDHRLRSETAAVALVAATWRND
jgi:16S rRNA (uracil1498-N3)-methyltransferase